MAWHRAASNMSADDERRKYEADVAYEVWRSGGDPDEVYASDDVYEDYHAHVPVDDAAAAQLRTQRRRR